MLLADAPSPLLKWPGGKRGELRALAEVLPATPGRLHEPFVGGGAVWFATDPAIPAEVNDTSADLVALYRVARDLPAGLAGALTPWTHWWSAIGEQCGPAVASLAGRVRPDGTLPASGVQAVADAVAEALPATLAEPEAGLGALARPDARQRVREATQDAVRDKARRVVRGQARRGRVLPEADVVANLEAAVRGAVYTLLRGAYNDDRAMARDAVEAVAAGARPVTTADARRAAVFWLVRELAYGAMFRFNGDGRFNVPYGGISYNGRDLGELVRRVTDPAVRARLATTTIRYGDFKEALRAGAPSRDDVVFVDPPYAARFSTYDNVGFGTGDHARLAATLADLDCRFVLVVQDVGPSRSLYARSGWQVGSLDKTYAWTVKERNDRRARLLVVTNADDVADRLTASERVA